MTRHRPWHSTCHQIDDLMQDPQMAGSHALHPSLHASIKGPCCLQVMLLPPESKDTAAAAMKQALAGIISPQPGQHALGASMLTYLLPTMEELQVRRINLPGQETPAKGHTPAGLHRLAWWLSSLCDQAWGCGSMQALRRAEQLLLVLEQCPFGRLLHRRAGLSQTACMAEHVHMPRSLRRPCCWLPAHYQMQLSATWLFSHTWCVRSLSMQCLLRGPYLHCCSVPSSK